MQITVNGGTEILAGAIPLVSYLSAKGMENQQVIIEYNRQIMLPETWESIVLQESDCLEIFRIVGGG